MAASGSAVSGFTEVLGIKFGRDASKKRREARIARARITRLRNRQARRTFMRSFRQAQATTLTQGVASGAGLESSGVQGQLASGRSQFRTAVFEFGKSEDLARTANQRSNEADILEGMANTVTSFGDVIGGSF